MRAGGLLDDGETKTGARDTAGNTGFDSLKTIEDPGKIFPRNTDPFVEHRDDDVIAVVARVDRAQGGSGSRGTRWLSVSGRNVAIRSRTSALMSTVFIFSDR